MGKKIIFYLLSFVLFIIAGCAFDLAHISSDLTVMRPNDGIKKIFRIIEDTKIKDPPCGYHRTLNKDSKWELIGDIPEGEVYKSSNQILTIECSNVFEAYIVVVDGYLTGFYLPVQKGFVQLRNKIKLPII